MAKETSGGTWININGDDEKDHINIYSDNPRGKHDSIHINIDYKKQSFNINEKEDGNKTSTECKCYLTTACMRHYFNKFDDNCHELKTLRWFRDSLVSSEDIEHYYKIAPIIVETINNTPKNAIIYKYIYENVIKECVDAIHNGNYEFAYNRYKNSILSLEKTIIKKELQNKLVKTLKNKINT